MLTNEEYVEQVGLLCPFCQNTSLETVGQFESDINIVWQNIKCSSCKELDRYYINFLYWIFYC